MVGQGRAEGRLCLDLKVQRKKGSYSVTDELAFALIRLKNWYIARKIHDFFTHSSITNELELFVAGVPVADRPESAVRHTR